MSGFGDVGAVGIRRIDEVRRPARGSAPQGPKRPVPIGRRAPDPGAGDAHRPEAEAVDFDLAADLE